MSLTPINSSQAEELNILERKLESMVEATSEHAYTTTATPFFGNVSTSNGEAFSTFDIFNSIINTISKATGVNESDLVIDQVKPKKKIETIEIEVVEVVLSRETTPPPNA